MEWISNQPRLKGALKAITAAVEDVILNLSMWFTLHVRFTSVTRQQVGPVTLWRPDFATIKWPALALFFLSCVLVTLGHP